MPLAPSGTLFRPGSILVVALILLGIASGGLAIGYQRAQTRRCLAFYGSEAARRVSKAPSVELMKVAPSDRPGRLIVTDRYDVTSAKGIVHLRRGLVEDAGFRWTADEPAVALPLESWDHALVFTDLDGSRTTVVVNLDTHGGWLAVVGQGGRVALGRLGRGLSKWIEATTSSL
ncbi:MAG: hypothetical protein ACKOYJ_11315 [Planctomycetia bacterium]